MHRESFTLCVLRIYFFRLTVFICSGQQVSFSHKIMMKSDIGSINFTFQNLSDVLSGTMRRVRFPQFWANGWSEGPTTERSVSFGERAGWFCARSHYILQAIVSERPLAYSPTSVLFPSLQLKQMTLHFYFPSLNCMVDHRANLLLWPFGKRKGDKWLN